MEILLHKVCGRPASRTMTLRAAGPEDAAAFYALQNEVRAAMPHPEQFVPDTLENIARYLKEDLCIGGWDGGRLGAYFILRYCGQDAHNYAAFMGIPREEWDGWANAASGGNREELLGPRPAGMRAAAKQTLGAATRAVSPKVTERAFASRYLSYPPYISRRQTISKPLARALLRLY